jgi:hypothetical protein
MIKPAIAIDPDAIVFEVDLTVKRPASPAHKVCPVVWVRLEAHGRTADC